MNILIGLVALIIIGGVGYVVTSSPDPVSEVIPVAVESEMETEIETDVSTPENQAAAIEQPADVMDSEVTSVTETVSGPGVFTTYSESALAASTATHNVLFFHASWCPTCRALEKNIQDNAAAIPGDVAIFKVDYDTATALKQQYGVNKQHSLISVSTDGSAESSITHPNTLDQLLSGL